MTVRDTSLIAYYREVRKGLEPKERMVLRVLMQLGPVHDRRLLQALNQKEKQKPKRFRRVWEINQVTGRRHGLYGKGIVEDLGVHRGIWNGKAKGYHIWRVIDDARQPVGWVKLEDNKLPAEHKPPTEIKRQKAERTERVQRPILNRLAASEAGRVLQACRKVRGRKQTRQTKQGLLFA